jgi:hypothetical protein
MENLDADDPDSLTEAEDEAEGAITGYYTLSIKQNYALFDFLAGAGNNDGSVIQMSGIRGKPLDSSVDDGAFGYRSVSFFTLSELNTIDFSQRINSNKIIPIHLYDRDFRANKRGNNLVVSEQDFGSADEAALNKMLQYDLYIKFDKSRYIDKNNDIFEVTSNMQQIADNNKVSPNDIRLIMIFTS